MTVTLEEFMSDFTPAERAQVETRAQELIEEELSLRDLRRAHNLTQAHMADLLGVKQENISRLEQRADFLLSTMEDYVNALGGKLRLVAEFPDRKPVTIRTISDINDCASVRNRRGVYISRSRKTS